MIETTYISRRKWKKLDFETFEKILKITTFTTRQLTTENDINKYVENIIKFITQTVEATVSWKKKSDHVKFFWNEQCNIVIKKARRARRK